MIARETQINPLGTGIATLALAGTVVTKETVA